MPKEFTRAQSLRMRHERVVLKMQNRAMWRADRIVPCPTTACGGRPPARPDQ